MLNIFLILIGRMVAFTSRLLNRGHGSTWPGHIALSLNPNFIKDVLKSSRTKIILIAGTNGKTTTAKLLQSLLQKNGYSTFQNEAGANLLNGIASTLILNSNKAGKLVHDYVIFEVDENTLPLALSEFTPDYLIILNLFRDQLDRYGEVNTVALKWKKAIKRLPSPTTVILNADDPQIASLGKEVKANILYFGLNDEGVAQKEKEHAVDVTHCPFCNNPLTFNTIFFSHLGDWGCKQCKNKRPKPEISNFPIYPLLGVYNRYNLLAAVLCAQQLGIPKEKIVKSLKNFSPAFGRQEVLIVNGKRIQLFLSKNPTSFNQSLRTIAQLKAKHVLLVLNDRIPDGRDVSWIWDVDTEELDKKIDSLLISGDRCYDMGLRMKYAIQNSIRQFGGQNHNLKFKIIENLKEAVQKALKEIGQGETLYILPTYSAMLEVRKILTGHKIL